VSTPGDDLIQLLARTALRDRGAYEALYRATSGKLFGFALRILRRRDLAEDCLQEAFVSIWHRASDYRAERAQPFTWMAAVVRNRALDMLRAAPGQREVLDNDEVEAWDSETPDAARDATAQSDARALLRCLERLAPPQRQAIAASYFRGLAHGELARTLRQPLGTVKTWIRKGLLELRRCMEQA
jgi:RNA polymerase sigma-70 factor (ECF subfamily)